jgi:hypothetical protein
VSSERPSRDELRTTFQALLNLALTRGCATSGCCGLGSVTRTAIDVVAYDHPDAEAECIEAAYDAFDRACSPVA